MAIRDLTPHSYHEEVFRADILPRDQPWNAKGGHHVSVCSFGGETLVAVDGQTRDPWYYKPLIRAWMIAKGRKRR